MRQIKFKTPFIEKVLAILLIVQGILFISLFHVGSVSPKAGDYFYSVKNYSFLFYLIFFLPPTFTFLKNKILYSLKITAEKIEISYPLKNFFLKLHPNKPTLRLILPYEKINKISINSIELKIFYMQNNEKEMCEKINLLVSGTLKDNDLQYMKKSLSLNDIELIFSDEDITFINKIHKLLCIIIILGLIFMILLTVLLILAFTH